jgi:hypothetical protein
MRRPLIVTLVAAAACLLTFVLLLATVFAYLPNLRHARSAAGAETAATGRVALAIATALSACVVTGLFRFRRWAVTCAGIMAGLCANYAIATLLVRPQGRSAFIWILLFGCAWLAWQLVWKIAPKTVSGDAPGARPLGVKFLAALAAISLLLAPTIIRSDFRHHVPAWQMASHIFNFVLCAAFSFGLWNLREWARFLTEVTSFLAPLNVLPSLLGTSNHKAFVIAISISALMYAAWSVWYLRQDDIVKIFDARERSHDPGTEPWPST